MIEKKKTADSGVKIFKGRIDKTLSEQEKMLNFVASRVPWD